MARPPTPRQPSARDHKQSDAAVRRMLRVATGKAEKRDVDVHRVDSGSQAARRPITLAPMPWDAKR
jgi:hypothetical protein